MIEEDEVIDEITKQGDRICDIITEIIIIKPISCGRNGCYRDALMVPDFHLQPFPKWYPLLCLNSSSNSELTTPYSVHSIFEECTL